MELNKLTQNTTNDINLMTDGQTDTQSPIRTSRAGSSQLKIKSKSVIVTETSQE